MSTIEKDKKSTRTFKKLGFTFLETTEIVVTMRQLLADYQMYYFKMRNFHWDVEGPDFFDLHENFEQDYNVAKENIDIVAERIRSFGLKPGMSMKDIMEKSNIDEADSNLTAVEMVKEILMDMSVLHNSMLDVLNASLEIGDNVTEQIITDFMRRLEERNWMYTAFSKEA